jgi:outer membrane lipoprotein-sorting protein
MKHLLILFIIFTSTFTYSQTLDEIISKHIEASGGEENISAIKTMSMSGDLSMGQINGKLDFIAVKPDKIRFEMNIMGMKMLSILNGDNGWSTNPMDGGKIEEMKPDERENLKKLIETGNELLDYEQKGYKAELMPDGEVNGRGVYVIKLLGRDSIINHVDKETFLTIKKTTWEKGMDSIFEVETYISDYKNVNGMMFPGKLKSESEYKMLNRTVTFNTIEINKVYDDKLFGKPE